MSARGSSSSGTAALAASQGSAGASSSGAAAFVAVTFNVGAKTDLMFSGVGREEFQDKLRADLASLTQAAQ